MSMKTLFHNVLLKAIQFDQLSSSITIEPDPTIPVKATVITIPIREPIVYNNIKIDFHPIKEGDMAWFLPKDAREITIKNEKYYIINEQEILYLE